MKLARPWLCLILFVALGCFASSARAMVYHAELGRRLQIEVAA